MVVPWAGRVVWQPCGGGRDVLRCAGSRLPSLELPLLGPRGQALRAEIVMGHGCFRHDERNANGRTLQDQISAELPLTEIASREHRPWQ